ncbi:GNAT family N-acetyltransferase [Photobacterium atrarenae]|uniref:GNAT family N-acetyltransferase n=1 Tax=Photobacterium atrarenae TaxID=865757 RepID=A0ABY5GPN8_9GAMM|nr:GNAT family N-acetyltransferase [Photobacterium atrarenae]UTV30253.1 GNAT family N-acetyltransferase [Photobacterium atrarenae]
MMKKPFVIRTMTREEVDLAIEWAAQEGWNPGLDDAANYYAADPNGFLIGLLGDEPIATISAIRYDASFGFIGFYIVKPEYRGKGYGIQIWNTALESLEGCNIALDGVVAQQDNYKKSGFQLAYRNIRYEGAGGGGPALSPSIVPLSALSIDQLQSYDQAFFPAPRPQFLQTWLRQPSAQAYGIVKDGQLTGYGVIRQCRSGYKIGPIYADTPGMAEQLFLALKSTVSERDAIFLDVPEVNAEAVALAERYQMTVSFETARMYTQSEPELPLNRIYGVTSFEIG